MVRNLTQNRLGLVISRGVVLAILTTMFANSSIQAAPQTAKKVSPSSKHLAVSITNTTSKTIYFTLDGLSNEWQHLRPGQTKTWNKQFNTATPRVAVHFCRDIRDAASPHLPDKGMTTVALYAHVGEKAGSTVNHFQFRQSGNSLSIHRAP